MSKVKRYSLPIVLGVVAVALIAVGVLAMTIWRPAQQIVASRDGDQPFAMTRVGVFPLYGDTVNVKATADGDQMVWVAVGSPEDVAAWLQDEPYDEIVGLSSLETLKAISHGVDAEPQSGQTQSGEKEPETAEGARGENPLASDMWVAQKYGRGSVSVTLSGDEMNTSILAATDGVGPAPTITLTWDTPRSNLLAVVAFLAGGVVLLIALVVGVSLSRAHKRRLARSEHIRSREERAGVETTQIAIAEAMQAPAEVKRGDKPAPVEDPVHSQAVEEQPATPASHDVPRTQDTTPSHDTAKHDSKFQPEPEEESATEEPVVSEPSKPAPSPTAPSVETVTTDSGMMNLTALQGGGAFPTRSALRDARKRGVSRLVVDGRTFTTGTGDKQQSSDVGDVLEQRSMRPERWSEAMGETE